jgi:hypothetical protein
VKDGGMPEWSLLQDAYGPADRVPELLARASAETDLAADVWVELWGRLCHQGTVYSASYAAIPWLAVMASSQPSAALVPPVVLAAGIIASVDGPEDTSAVRSRYAEQIRHFSAIAQVSLDLADKPVDFIYALQSVAVFEDLGVWQRNVDRLVDGEFEIECPACSEHLYLEVGDEPPFVTTDPDAPAERGTAITPMSSHQLAGPEERLLQLALQHNQPEIAARLLTLYGGATCPSCGTPFEFPAALT